MGLRVQWGRGIGHGTGPCIYQHGVCLCVWVCKKERHSVHREHFRAFLLTTEPFLHNRLDHVLRIQRHRGSKGYWAGLRSLTWRLSPQMVDNSRAEYQMGERPAGGQHGAEARVPGDALTGRSEVSQVDVVGQGQGGRGGRLSHSQERGQGMCGRRCCENTRFCRTESHCFCPGPGWAPCPAAWPEPSACLPRSCLSLSSR